MDNGDGQAKMLVCYYSRTGHTQHMAEAIGKGANGVGLLTAEVKPIDQVEAGDLLSYDAIVIGSPTYYGSMAAGVKHLIDESVAFHGQLAGKVGGAFASSANVGGGNETTVMNILQAMLIHGMVVQGSATGDHYGPVAIGDMDKRAESQCRSYGRQLAELALKLPGR